MTPMFDKCVLVYVSTKFVVIYGGVFLGLW